ncbi:MAG: DUF423 domain-containing protein [Gammaproteobacteria bacterium]|nr:DUF423 domain-containing protein [Gammaproteobacteria bacterium]
MTKEHLQTTTAGRWIGVGALLAMLAVMLGAFGAHGLKSHFSEQQMAWYQTAFQYHIIHAIALIITGLASALTPSKNLPKLAGLCFLSGVLLFSGSLYTLALTQMRWLGAITPLGGIAFLFGWGLLAVAGFRINQKENPS